MAQSGPNRTPRIRSASDPKRTFADTQRLIRQVRGQEIREGLPRLLVGALLVPVGAKFGEAMRRPGIDLDLIGNARALQLP